MFKRIAVLSSPRSVMKSFLLITCLAAILMPKTKIEKSNEVILTSESLDWKSTKWNLGKPAAIDLGNRIVEFLICNFDLKKQKPEHKSNSSKWMPINLPQSVSTEEICFELWYFIFVSAVIQFIMLFLSCPSRASNPGVGEKRDEGIWDATFVLCCCQTVRNNNELS